ncbi:hypothetical protein [[Pseudomonas] boreopolis]|uniref:hypothetical protein n=1 Tax=Xanthomonas boreopolis TaxID=86183 RepID=UPI003DA0CD8F
MKAMFLMIAFTVTSCDATERGGVSPAEGKTDQDAVAAIGDVPRDMTAFSSTDCDKPEKLSDCSARDAQGREYAFFDGALSRIVVKKGDAKLGVVLPAGMVFGEDIEASKEKASGFYRISFDRGEINGGTVYSSGFDIRSPSGIEYSIELIADESGKLKEVIQRTDF